MTLQITVNNLAKRLLVVIAGLGVCAILVFMAITNCAVGLLTDPQVNVSRELLVAGSSLVPNSALLNARLAEAEMSDENRDILGVEQRATRAVNSSPWDYRLRLLLATVKEAGGDRAAAERELQEALALAPNYAEVHWRLANLLLRQGKLSKAVVEFRVANSSTDKLLQGTLDLIWRVSSGNVPAVQAVTPRDPKSQLTLAQFFLRQSRHSEAITTVSGIDRNALAGLSELSSFVTSLITEGRAEEARGLWVGLVSGTYAKPGQPLPALWNGGFESDIAADLNQFDWSLNRNEYAVPSLDSGTAHGGSRSLRLDFAGRDTTRLDGQIKQTVVVRPGSRYRLECYVKTDRLETPEAPRVVVLDQSSSTEIATSEPLPSGSNDWRLVSLEFTAPPNARTATVTMRRLPKFSFDKPTRGTIWFDDFALTEITK